MSCEKNPHTAFVTFKRGGLPFKVSSHKFFTSTQTFLSQICIECTKLVTVTCYQCVLVKFTEFTKSLFSWKVFFQV